MKKTAFYLWFLVVTLTLFWFFSNVWYSVDDEPGIWSGVDNQLDDWDDETNESNLQTPWDFIPNSTFWLGIDWLWEQPWVNSGGYESSDEWYQTMSKPGHCDKALLYANCKKLGEDEYICCSIGYNTVPGMDTDVIANGISAPSPVDHYVITTNNGDELITSTSLTHNATTWVTSDTPASVTVVNSDWDSIECTLVGGVTIGGSGGYIVWYAENECGTYEWPCVNTDERKVDFSRMDPACFTSMKKDDNTFETFSLHAINVDEVGWSNWEGNDDPNNDDPNNPGSSNGIECTITADTTDLTGYVNVTITGSENIRYFKRNDGWEWVDYDPFLKIGFSKNWSLTWYVKNEDWTATGECYITISNIDSVEPSLSFNIKNGVINTGIIITVEDTTGTDSIPSRVSGLSWDTLNIKWSTNENCDNSESRPIHLNGDTNQDVVTYLTGFISTSGLTISGQYYLCIETGSIKDKVWNGNKNVVKWPYTVGRDSIPRCRIKGESVDGGYKLSIMPNDTTDFVSWDDGETWDPARQWYWIKTVSVNWLYTWWVKSTYGGYIQFGYCTGEVTSLWSTNPDPFSCELSYYNNQWHANINSIPRNPQTDLVSYGWTKNGESFNCSNGDSNHSRCAANGWPNIATGIAGNQSDCIDFHLTVSGYGTHNCHTDACDNPGGNVNTPLHISGVVLKYNGTIIEHENNIDNWANKTLRSNLTITGLPGARYFDIMYCTWITSDSCANTGDYAFLTWATSNLLNNSTDWSWETHEIWTFRHWRNEMVRFVAKDTGHNYYSNIWGPMYIKYDNVIPEISFSPEGGSNGNVTYTNTVTIAVEDSTSGLSWNSIEYGWSHGGCDDSESIVRNPITLSDVNNSVTIETSTIWSTADLHLCVKENSIYDKAWNGNTGTDAWTYAREIIVGNDVWCHIIKENDWKLHVKIYSHVQGATSPNDFVYSYRWRPRENYKYNENNKDHPTIRSGLNEVIPIDDPDSCIGFTFTTTGNVIPSVPYSCYSDACTPKCSIIPIQQPGGTGVRLILTGNDTLIHPNSGEAIIYYKWDDGQDRWRDFSNPMYLDVYENWVHTGYVKNNISWLTGSCSFNVTSFDGGDGDNTPPSISFEPDSYNTTTTSPIDVIIKVTDDKGLQWCNNAENCKIKYKWTTGSDCQFNESNNRSTTGLLYENGVLTGETTVKTPMQSGNYFLCISGSASDSNWNGGIINKQSWKFTITSPANPGRTCAIIQDPDNNSWTSGDVLIILTGWNIPDWDYQIRVGWDENFDGSNFWFPRDPRIGDGRGSLRSYKRLTENSIYTWYFILEHYEEQGPWHDYTGFCTGEVTNIDKVHPTVSFNKNSGNASDLIITVDDSDGNNRVSGLSWNENGKYTINYTWSTDQDCTSSQWEVLTLTGSDSDQKVMSGKVSIDWIADGNYYLCVATGSIKDKAWNGNLGNKSTWKFTINSDNQWPVISFNPRNGNNVTGIVITATDVDNNLSDNPEIKYLWQTGSECSRTGTDYTATLSLNRDWGKTASGTLIPNWLSGNYYLCVRSGSVLDTVWNENTGASAWEFYFHNSNPTCSISRDTGRTNTNVELTVSSDFTITKIDWYFNETFIVGGKVSKYTAFENGIYRVNFYELNWLTGSCTGEVTNIDRIPPTVDWEVSSLSTGLWVKVYDNNTGSDINTGLQVSKWKWVNSPDDCTGTYENSDHKTLEPWTADARRFFVSTDGLSIGTHYLCIYENAVYDNAWNGNEAKPIDVTIQDDGPLQECVITASNNGNWTNGNVILEIQNRNDGYQISWFSFDDGSYSMNYYRTEVSRNWVYTWYIWYKNWEKVSCIVTVDKIDTKDPVCWTWTYSNNNTRTSGSVTATLNNSQDDDSGMEKDSYTCTIYSNNSDCWVSIKDNAWNQVSCTSSTVDKIDNNRPYIEFNSDSTGITITVRDDESGLKSSSKIEYRWQDNDCSHNNGDGTQESLHVQDWTKTASIRLPTNWYVGEKYLCLDGDYAFDLAWNGNTPYGDLFTFGSNPTCRITQNPDENTWTGGTYGKKTLTIVVTSNSDITWYSWTGWANYSETNTKIVTENWRYTWYIVDSNWLIGECGVLVDKIDKTPPECGNWTYSPNLFNTNRRTSGDVTAGIYGATDTGAWLQESQQLECTINNYLGRCSIRIYDKVWNSELCNSETISYIDNTGPEITFIPTSGTTDKVTIRAVDADNNLVKTINHNYPTVTYRWQTGEDCSVNSVDYTWVLELTGRYWGKEAFGTMSTTWLTNGEYYLCVRGGTVFDSLWNSNDWARSVGKFTFDATMPTCSISLSTKDYTTGLTLTIYGSDNVMSTWYSWDGSNFSSNNTKRVSENGTYTAYVKDSYWNIKSCSTIVQNIDKTWPTITFNPDGGNASSVDVIVTDDLNILKSGSSIKYRWQSGSTCSPSLSDYIEKSIVIDGKRWTVSLPTNGLTGDLYLCIFADSAFDSVWNGNLSAKSDKFTFGSVEPWCSISKNPVQPTNGNVDLRVTTQNWTKYSWTWFGNMVTSTGMWTMTGNGSKTFFIEDNNWNTGSCSVTISNIDKVGPTITFNPDGGLRNGSVDIIIRDDQNDLRTGSTIKYTWQTDSACSNIASNYVEVVVRTWADTKMWTVTLPTDKLNGNWYLCVLDNSVFDSLWNGNLPARSKQFTFNSVSPTCTITQSPGGAIWTGGDVTLTITGSTSVTKYSWDASNRSDLNWSATRNVSINWRYTWYVMDSNWLTNECGVFVGNIDKDWPDVTITPDGGNPINVTITVSDSQNNLVSSQNSQYPLIKYRWQNTSNCTPSQSQDIRTLTWTSWNWGKTVSAPISTAWLTGELYLCVLSDSVFDIVWNGNIAKTSNRFYFDPTRPRCEISAIPSSWTSGNVVLTPIIYWNNIVRYSWTWWNDMNNTISTWTMTTNGTVHFYVQSEGWLTGECSKDISYIDRTAPQLTANNPIWGECTLLTGSVTATNETCGNLKYIWNNLGTWTNIWDFPYRLTKPWTMIYNVMVMDCAWNVSNTNVTYTWNDTLPSLANVWYNYPNAIKSSSATQIWNIVELLWAVDWACGSWSEFINATAVSCTVWSGSLNTNILSVTAPANSNWTSICTITFSDDETNIITWNFIYTYDTKVSWWGGGWWGGWWGGWRSSKKTDEDDLLDDMVDLIRDDYRDEVVDSFIPGNQYPTYPTYSTYTPAPSPSNRYSAEMNEAFEFARRNGITTMSNIEAADMYGWLTRIAMAKMLSQYAINVLHKTPDYSRNNTFIDVPSDLNNSYNNWVTLAYQLWIMWMNMQYNKFRPKDLVTRAEFATALSRLLYGTSDWQYKWTVNYYIPHMTKLFNAWILTNNNPQMLELRWYVMLMLMRSASKR